MSEASYPADLLYHSEHDWARIAEDAPGTATLGITWYAQDALGEVVFFELPAVGTATVKDAPYAEIESVKAVSDVVVPTAGSSRNTTSPSASWAYQVMPSVAVVGSSWSIRAQSCSW